MSDLAPRAGDTIAIPRRFNGPPESSNGGYACGRVAAFLAGPAEVSLRAPPPLERPLAVEPAGGGVLVRDGETLVAEGRPARVELPVPEPVGVSEAAAARRAGYERSAARHPFPTCFVCGPERAPGDGLNVLAGPVGDTGLFACDWTPDGSLTGEDGLVRAECVWAVLDCPSSAPVANAGGRPPLVLGRLAARIERPVEAARPHVVLSWRVALEGRKRHAGSALFTAEGALLARARALWIELLSF
jgi:hypothetical protein